MTGGAGATAAAVVVVLVLLTAAAALVVGVGRLGHTRGVVVAAVRAVVQLAAVSLVLTAVLRSAGWTGVFVAGMYLVAVLTSAGRIGSVRRAGWVALPIGCGVLPVLALLVGSGVVPEQPISVLPVAGILIGGAMTATSLAGRRAVDELRTRRGEYEAALALGLPTRAAALEICRGAAGQALVPVLDQTRTVGLVALPGTFVGVLLGGASPMRAGLTQLVVLIALLLVEAIAVLVAVELVAAGRIDRRPPARTPVRSTPARQPGRRR